MTEYIRKNFCFTDPTCESGDTFVECNIEQVVPDTAICAGVTDLTFTRCRVINCTVPGDATVDGGNTSQIDFCTNLHPKRIDHGQTPCVENCRHVVDTIEIVGGPDVYEYEDLSV